VNKDVYTKYWQWCKKSYKKKIQDVDELREGVVEEWKSWHRLCHQRVALSTKGMCESKRQTFRTQIVKAQTVNNCCLLDCIDESNIRGPETWMTAICTSVRVCHVLINYLHSCTELKFTIQQSSLNVLCFFNPQLLCYNCCKFHSNRLRSVRDILQNQKCGPMPNVMAALPNIGDALCSTPQSLDGAHY